MRTVAFGDLETGRWGIAVAPDAGPALLVLGSDGQTESREVTLQGDSPDVDWRITGEDLELVVSPTAGAVLAEGADPAQQGFDQLCGVEGWPGSDSAAGSRGLRSARAGAGGFASVRAVAAWFEPAEGLALAAFRPEGAKGQESDIVSAAVLDAEGAVAVEDPRLSTTYGADGWASRAGLELWIGAEDDGQELRRASGEAVGPRASATVGELELSAELFRWNRGGREGTGVYVLTRRR